MLRLLELYASVQGECDRTGVPTQFVRFAGCNLRCSGWPCDSPFSIFPKQFMKEQKLIAVRSEAGSAAQGLISNIVLIANDTGAKNICLTGGEPLLQPKDELVDLVKSLVENWDYTLEMFSNGTLEYPRALMHHCAIRVDWKLPGSQEAQSGTNWDQRVNNYYAMGEWDHHTIKFTIKNQADFEAAMAIYEKFDMEAWPGTIYAGPVWESDIAAKDIVDGILTCRLPWRLNMQIHNHVWPPQERGH